MTDQLTLSTTLTPIRVLGGTGKTGARIVHRLRAAGAPVTALGRSTPVAFDWADRSTWDRAVDGAERLYIAYSPDLAVPGALDDIRDLTARCRQAGVRRLVLLSGRGEPEAQEAEDVVRHSGIDWTIVRCSWFFQNFTESYLREPLVAGELVLPTVRFPEPFVDADDIADVATAALLDDRHVGELYELTGPELLTFGQVAETVADLTGREVRYVPVDRSEYVTAARADGVPEEVVSLLDYLFHVVLDGRNASLTDGVHRALGREPRTFLGFAREAARAGLWG